MRRGWKTSLLFPMLSGLISLPHAALASNQATQLVSFQVLPINKAPRAFADSTIIAEGPAQKITDTSTTYSIRTNQTKITGALDSPMPIGTALSINLAAPKGAESRGTVTLSTTPTHLVRSFSRVYGTSESITYTLSATPEAKSVAMAPKTVILTIVDDV